MGAWEIVFWLILVIWKPGIGNSGVVNPTKKGVSLAESMFILENGWSF